MLGPYVSPAKDVFKIATRINKQQLKLSQQDKPDSPTSSNNMDWYDGWVERGFYDDMYDDYTMTTMTITRMTGMTILIKGRKISFY